jgi:glycosyltransferase involved in cell wall biosynthesis
MPIPAMRSSVPRQSDVSPVRAVLILPAFNEELGLRSVLSAIDDLGIDLEIVVVDDGSTDGTASVAQAAGVQVVRHPRNRGKGAALRSGIAAASGDRLLTMDADATYPVSVIPRLVELLGEHDYVSAARRIGRIHIPLLNRIGNGAMAMLIRILSGSRLRDPFTGMYGLRRQAYEALRLRSEGFGIETEIAMKAATSALRTTEIWVEYGPREGSSKLHPIRDGLVILRTMMNTALDGRVRRRRAVP